MAERSKAMVYGGSLAGVEVLNSTGGTDACLLRELCVVSATGRSLVRKSSPIESGMSLCVIQKPRGGGLGPCWEVAPEQKINYSFVKCCFSLQFSMK